MVTTLFSPRVSQALEYDASCKKCFQEFNATYLLTQKKVEQLVARHAKSEREIFQTISTQASILSRRVDSLAKLIKAYIHENGALTPRRSISPRSQSLVPNIQMLRRIKLAQSLQLKIYQQLEYIESQAKNYPDPSSPILKERKFSVKEYQVIKNIELSLLKMVLKVSEFTIQYFPSFKYDMKDLLREAEQVKAEVTKKKKKPRASSASLSKQGKQPSFNLDFSSLPVDQTSLPVLEKSRKARLRSSFMSRTMECLDPPSLEVQAQKLKFTCEEQNVKLVNLLNTLKSGDNINVLASALGDRSAACDMIKCLSGFVGKVHSRSKNIWHTLHRVKPLQKELLQPGIQGLKQCIDLQLRFKSSIEEMLNQLNSKGEKAEPQYKGLSKEFEEEIKKLNQQTYPLLINMSAAIQEIFGKIIAKKVKILLEQVDSNPRIEQLLLEIDEMLFKAEANLEESLEKHKDSTELQELDLFIHSCLDVIGSYQCHEVVQDKVLKHLSAARAL